MTNPVKAETVRRVGLKAYAGGLVLNPRWVAWATTQPFGEPLHNYAFMAWIQSRWTEFCATKGLVKDMARSEAEHNAFDAWLESTL